MSVISGRENCVGNGLPHFYYFPVKLCTWKLKLIENFISEESFTVYYIYSPWVAWKDVPGIIVFDKITWNSMRKICIEVSNEDESIQC